MPKAAHARRRGLPDEVASRIQSRILDGSLRPGDRLPPERELALQLQVNRSSVREALKKLEQLRLVDVQQGSGTRVRDTHDASFDVIWSMLFPEGKANVPMIRDLLEMCELVAPEALRIGMLRASDQELDAAVTSLRTLAGEEFPVEDFAEALVSLHVVFAQLSRNRVLLILANSVTRFLSERGFEQAVWVTPADRHVLRPLVLRLAVAMQARDSDTADPTARELMRRLSKLVLDGLDHSATAVDATPDSALQASADGRARSPIFESAARSVAKIPRP